MENKKHKPDEIPTSATFPMTICYGISGWRTGEVFAYAFDAEGDQEKVVLHKTTFTCDIPRQKKIKEKVVKTLQNELQKIKAENFIKEKAIQDKIDNLLAIEYHPTRESADNGN